MAPAASVAPACSDASVHLGHAHALTQLHAYLDPTADTALGTVLELRRLVAERPEDVAVTLHWTHLGMRLDPREDRVRVWAAAMAGAGHVMGALRVIRRDGVDRVYVRLGTTHGRAGLAKELAIDAGALDQLAGEDCHEQRLDDTRRDVASRMSDRGTAVFRLPVFVVDDLTFEDSGLLDQVRPVLARRRSRARTAAERPPAGAPTPKASSLRLLRPNVRAAPLGGPGLRHTFVLLVRGEEDPSLFTLLPPVLAYRRDHPAEVSVYVVARGLGLEQGLRQRMCRAEAIGLMPAYLQYLSRDPALRFSDPATDQLLSAIDSTVLDPACDLDPNEDEEALPDGGWLDGVPVTRGDLEGLGKALETLDAAHHPLTAVLAPPDDAL